MLHALLALQSAGFAPPALSAATRTGARAVAPQMLFNFGQKEESEVKELVIDRPEPEYETAEPEPGYENPGMATFSEMELAEQEAKLEALAAKWRRRQEQIEYDEKTTVGFVAKAEAINGRMAMFFLIVGLITEYYTGESIPGQVVVMAQTLGVID